MTAKKINKSAFVRNLPATMPAKDVVAKAKASGFSMTPAHVYAIRSKDNAGTVQVKRGPGRPASVSTPVLRTAPLAARGTVPAAGLVGEIERIVERKVSELLRAKLGTLLP